MVGGPNIVFCQYHEFGKSQICNYTDVKICSKIVGFDANSRYLYCSGQEMPCSKEEYVEVEQPYDMEELCNQVMSSEFFQVDIHAPDELIDKFSKFCPLFVMDSIPDNSIPSHLKEYQMKTG